MSESTSAASEPAFPDLQMFSRRRTRRAVVRGLMRTAVLALMLFLAFNVAGAVFGYAAFALHNRSGAFDRVGVVGLNVAHPGINFGQQSYGTTDSGWLSTTKIDRYRQPDGTDIETDVRMDTLGHISVRGQLESKLDTALFEGRATPAQARTFIDGLPASAVADVVVDFTVPLTSAATADVLTAEHLQPDFFTLVEFYDSPYAGARRVFRQSGGGSSFDGAVKADRPVSWINRNVSYGFHSFADWTRALRKSDDANLARVGLPSSAELKQLGRHALVHGVYLRDLTPAQLSALMRNPSVGSITPVDVRLTILHRDQS